MLDKLEIPPGNSDPFFWADFIELRVIAHPDKCFSRGDLSSLEKRSRDMGNSFDSARKWKDVADFVQTRQIEFGSAYPFLLSDDGDTVLLNYAAAPNQKAYLALLLASCLRNIKKKERGYIARMFEEACSQIFSKLMPVGSEVRATWAGGGAYAVYKGSLYKKMISVAADIRCKPSISPGDFKRNNSGDGGIDLIAWHPMADNRCGIPIAFAQCGCSKEDWKFKQLEASYARHSWKFPVMHPWANFYFMPLDMRDSSGDWANKNDLGGAIVVDRMRLLRLAEQYDLFRTLPRLPYIERALSSSYI